MFPLRVYQRDEMPVGARPITLGCRGRDVLALQRKLSAAGYPGETDGRYGYATQWAVRGLQARNGLRVDGVAGRETLAVLRSVAAEEGFSSRRVRPGETIVEAAKAMGVAPEALCRRNRLRANAKLTPGALLTVPARLMLIADRGEIHGAIKSSAVLGPRMVLSGPEQEPAGDRPPDHLPWLCFDEDFWNRLLHTRRSGEFDFIMRLARAWSGRRWVLELPAQVWRRSGKLMSFFDSMRRHAGAVPLPLVSWPGRRDPLPDIKGLARFTDLLIVDPNILSFDFNALSLSLRRLASSIAPRRLILWLRSGGLGRRGRDFESMPAREARIEAISAHARLVWDENNHLYQAAYSGETGERRIRLLEEKGLFDRVRLADRLNLGGVVLDGLSGLHLPNTTAWPGEFAVLDNFLQKRHIN